MELPEQQTAVGGDPLTFEMVEIFLNHLRAKGCKPGTLAKYRNVLLQMLSDLPGNRMPERGKLLLWRDSLLTRGYTPRTVNSYVSIANSLFVFLERRDLQINTLQRVDDSDQPELTRMEYLRLLQAAKFLEKERLYLLVKVFGSIGIPVQELEMLTVEAIKRGKVTGGRQELRIPSGLKRELLAYAEREGVTKGPVFITKGGLPLNRTNLTMALKQLCKTAQVEEEKATPRCLRKLCVDMQMEIFENFRQLAEQSYDRLLEAEEVTVAWDLYTR